MCRETAEACALRDMTRHLLDKKSILLTILLTILLRAPSSISGYVRIALPL